ncbi:hypothetical protein F4677DRAFT_457287 [Hypoxylon crocopeplum]|nr:hypothetical protein F4677DRAFT_457287 [Hypoxylon crocopeplum]
MHLVTKRHTSHTLFSHSNQRLGLNWTAAGRDDFLANVNVVDIKRLVDLYLTDDYFAAGTPKAREAWEAYLKGRKLKDIRYNHGKRREIINLDYSRLQYIIKQDESVIFRDADTKKVFLVVLRKFVPDEDVRKTMVDICQEIIKYRRDDRREDPGRLVHYGYTCGSRHDPKLQLATPCISMDTDFKRERERKLNNEAQGMAWIIIADYNDTISENDLPRMDMLRDDDTFTFKQIIALAANAPKDPTKGGNFYLASYGIMMYPASNTVSAWVLGDHHGTTLYEMKTRANGRDDYEVREDGDFNTGLVFEISRAMKADRQISAWLDECKRDRMMAQPSESKTLERKRGDTKHTKPRRKRASKPDVNFDDDLDA